MIGVEGFINTSEMAQQVYICMHVCTIECIHECTAGMYTVYMSHHTNTHGHAHMQKICIYKSSVPFSVYFPPAQVEFLLFPKEMAI